MPHSSSPPNRSFLAPPRTLASYDRGRDLCTFVSAAASHVMRTLQRPCRSKPSKRKVNHRRFLQNQICRSFSDIEAATHRLASSILSQEACVPPAAIQQRSPSRPPMVRLPSAVSSFSGIAEAFVAPDPSPSWALSLDALTSEPDELFEPITRESSLAGVNSWEPLNLYPSGGSSLVGWTSQPHAEPASCMEPNAGPSTAVECLIPALDSEAFVTSGHDSYFPLWDLESW
ncbi:uncharacterized protein C19orf85 homolog [Anolis carolinensis]|uniref:uncharacterized protein C19orf85 homolog n=1 Tax=Anolis carolinensis TaxID=28377 RepID=UPI002F2B8AC4